MEETILKLAQDLGVAADQLIYYYAKWYFTAGLLYSVLAIVLMIISYKLIYKPINKMFESPTDGKYIAGVVLVLIILVLGAMIAYNVPDMISPEGVGVHHIIEDLRG